MKGARSLATSWPLAEKPRWEAAMEQPFSAKSASFQVGEPGLGQVACLSASPLSFAQMGVNIPQGSKTMSSDNHPTLCGTPKGNPCHW